MKLFQAAAFVAMAPLLLSVQGLPADAAPTGATRPHARGEVEVRLADLDRGPNPAISWLALNTVHTPNGRTHRLPWTKRAAERRELTLYGRTPSGWVVTDLQRYEAEHAWVVKGDEKTPVGTASVTQDQRTWRVARDGSALLGRVYTEGTASVRVTRLSDGAPVGDRDFDGSGAVLDFDGTDALIGVDGDTVRWQPGQDPTSVGAVAVAGDLVHDVLVVPGAAPGTVGPTTISAPGTPAWEAPLERVEVSPDGRFLLGLVTGDRRGDGKHIEVRRMSDGGVVAAFHVRNMWRLTVQWEGQMSIAFEITRTARRRHVWGEVDALARCRLNGECTRATAWFSSRRLSMVRAPQIVD